MRDKAELEREKHDYQGQIQAIDITLDTLQNEIETNPDNTTLVENNKKEFSDLNAKKNQLSNKISEIDDELGYLQ